jgi:hypothetical protein
MTGWKFLDDRRKERNKEIRQEHAIRVTQWEAERDLAKQQHRRPGWKKPSIKGLLFSPLPKLGYAVEMGEKAVVPDSDEEDEEPQAGDGEKHAESDSDSDSNMSAGSDNDSDE